MKNSQDFLVDKQFFQPNPMWTGSMSLIKFLCQCIDYCGKIPGGIRHERGKNHPIRGRGNRLFNGKDGPKKEGAAISGRHRSAQKSRHGFGRIDEIGDLISVDVAYLETPSRGRP